MRQPDGKSVDFWRSLIGRSTGRIEGESGGSQDAWFNLFWMCRSEGGGARITGRASGRMKRPREEDTDGAGYEPQQRGRGLMGALNGEYAFTTPSLAPHHTAPRYVALHHTTPHTTRHHTTTHHTIPHHTSTYHIIPHHPHTTIPILPQIPHFSQTHTDALTRAPAPAGHTEASGSFATWSTAEVLPDGAEVLQAAEGTLWQGRTINTSVFSSTFRYTSSVQHRAGTGTGMGTRTRTETGVARGRGQGWEEG